MLALNRGMTISAQPCYTIFKKQKQDKTFYAWNGGNFVHFRDEYDIILVANIWCTLALFICIL